MFLPSAYPTGILHVGVERRVKDGGKIGEGELVRLDGPPVGGSLRSPRPFTTSIKVTKAREILVRFGNCH